MIKSMYKTAVAMLTLSSWAALSASAAAEEPLYTKNLSPITGLLGLPAQRAATTAQQGGLDVALHSTIASHYRSDGTPTEYLNLDGETVRLALELRYGVAENWDLQLELPWLDHSGGNLDRLIDDWHDLWGMSDGGRKDVPRDLLDYRYATAGTDIALQDDASGLGDVSLSLTHAFFRDDKTVASLVLGYKFGTGDEDDFLGSGADDVFIALRFSGDHLSDLPLRWHGQAGYLRAGNSDFLGDTQERNLWFAGLTLDWMVAERWSLIAQLDGHAAPMDSDITALGDDAFMLTLGARWYFAQSWSLDFSVVEDIRVETAPDVMFQASLRYRLTD